MTLLASQNITLDRGADSRFTYPDLNIKEKDTVLLTGASGSGKTTFLSILAGLLPPTTGSVAFQGQDFYALERRNRDQMRGQRMGFVFQALHLLPSLTLRQNIALAASMSGNALDDARLDDLLSQLGLSHRAHAKPDALSQGEQQRAAIARAVLNKPALILADEPTSALDRDNAFKVIELLQWQAEQTGAALLVGTHDDRIMGVFDKVIPIQDIQKSRAA